MTIPAELKVLGHVYRVEQRDTDDDGMGFTKRAENLIVIKKSMSDDQKEATLIHEMMHALNGELDNDRAGHERIEWLAETLYAILKENDMLK